MNSYQIALPGLTEYDPRVLEQLSGPLLPHYGDEWLTIYNDIIEKMKRVYRTENTVFILPSSGSGAVDAVFTSLGEKSGLILSNGTFGKRIFAIASQHLQPAELIEVEQGQPFDLNRVQQVIRDGQFDLLAVVHGETSTGMLNHLEPFSELCGRYGLLFVVDAVSTAGGVELDVDRQVVDLCISASQKAIGAPPGLAMVSVSERAWEAMPPEECVKSW